MASKLQIKSISEQAQRTLTTLLANAIGLGPEYRKDLNITLEDIPDSLVWERRLFDVICALWEGNTPAAEEAIATRIASFANDDYDAALKQVQNYQAEYKTSDGPGLRFLSHFYYIAIDQDRLRETASYIKALADNPGAKTSAQVIETGITALAAASPKVQKIRVIDTDDMRDEMLARQREKYEAWKLGKSTAPTIPFLDEAVRKAGGAAVLDEGDPILITAVKKYGKTTLAQWMVDHYMMEGYYVISAEVETNSMVSEQRRWARTIGLPTFVWKQAPQIHGKVYPPCSDKAPEWKHVIESFREVYASIVKMGNHKPRHMHDPSVRDMDMFKVRLQSEVDHARSLGLTPLLIYDYLQKANWRKYHHDERQGLAILAHEMKNIIEGMGIYAIIFAQEQTDPTAQPVEDRHYPFGSKEAQRAFQGQISLQRKRADTPKPVTDGGGNVMYNALGLPRVYSYAGGNMFQGESTLKVILANEMPAVEAPIIIENPLFNVYAPGQPPQYETLIEGISLD